MLRGYDVVAIIFENHGLHNEVPLRSYLRNRFVRNLSTQSYLLSIISDITDFYVECFLILSCFDEMSVQLINFFLSSVPVLVLPKVPEDLSNNLMEWFDCSGDVFDSLRDIMQTSYEERVHKLLEMPKKARDKFWWPFTQHSLVPEGGVAVIDSRCGENFAIFKVSFCMSYMLFVFNKLNYISLLNAKSFRIITIFIFRKENLLFLVFKNIGM